MIERKVKSIRALERGLDVLAEVQRSGGISLHELHVRLGLAKATLLRLLVTLASRGHIWQRLADGAYLPTSMEGPKRRPDVSDRLAEVASPLLVELSERVVWPSILAVPRMDHLEIIETNSRLARFDAAVLGPVGVKLSYLHTATGRAYLAACSAQERAAIIARLQPAGATEAELELLETIIAETRTRGYSTREPHHPWADRNRQTVLRDGKSSIGVAICVGGHAVAALNVTWPARRVSVEDVVARHLSAVQSIAERIGNALEAM
jgi:IclR family mhp operon transcriptional activator